MDQTFDREALQREYLVCGPVATLFAFARRNRKELVLGGSAAGAVMTVAGAQKIHADNMQNERDKRDLEEKKHDLERDKFQFEIKK